MITKYVPLTKICPIFTAKITAAYIERMTKYSSELSEYDLLLAVQKIPGKDMYNLLGGYDRYHYMITSGYTVVPCLIESNTSDTNQDLKVLRRLFQPGDIAKVNKQSLLNKLNKSHIDVKIIIDRTGFKTESIKDFTYSKKIPSKFINRYTTVPTLNWVENLNLNNTVKEFLYLKAGQPAGRNDRLTGNSIKLIKKFLSREDRFPSLPIARQILILKQAINFKGIVIEHLVYLVDSFSKPEK